MLGWRNKAALRGPVKMTNERWLLSFCSTISPGTAIEGENDDTGNQQWPWRGWRMPESGECVRVSWGAVGRWSLERRMARCSREMVEWRKALYFLLFPYSLHCLEELCFSCFWWYRLQQTRAGLTLIRHIPWWLGREENMCKLTSHPPAFTSPYSPPPILFSFKTGFYLLLWILFFLSI